MLEIVIPGKELFDEVREEFIYTKACEIRLEHSLVSLSKWEAKHRKPFLSARNELTRDEMIDYIRCMTITQNVPEDAYYSLSDTQIKKVFEYVDEPMTATWFSNNKTQSSPSREVVTSEIIYYWMTAHEIDWKAEKWHLNRLLTLIRVCNAKNGNSGKMSKRDIMKQNQEINAARRKACKTSG